MGIWQDVTLSAQGPVALDTPQIITTLPLPDTSRAAVSTPHPAHQQHRRSRARHARHRLRRRAHHPRRHRSAWRHHHHPHAHRHARAQHHSTRGSGGRTATARPSSTTSPPPSASIARARNAISDERQTPLRHPRDHLRALAARLLRPSPPRRSRPHRKLLLADKPLVDETHEGIRETPLGWVASLTPAGEHSPAVHDVDDLRDPTRAPHQA